MLSWQQNPRFSAPALQNLVDLQIRTLVRFALVCQEPYQYSSSGTFPNNEINHATLDVSNSKADDCSLNLICEHERVCRITASGTIRISNE